MAAKKVAVVVQPDDSPVEVGVLATAILDIAVAAKKLAKSGLNRKAVIALVQDDTNLPKSTIKTVLDSLESLARTYTE